MRWHEEKARIAGEETAIQIRRGGTAPRRVRVVEVREIPGAAVSAQMGFRPDIVEGSIIELDDGPYRVAEADDPGRRGERLELQLAPQQADPAPKPASAAKPGGERRSAKRRGKGTQ